MTPRQLADEVTRAARDRRWDDVDRFLDTLVLMAMTPRGLAAQSTAALLPPPSLEPSDPAP